MSKKGKLERILNIAIIAVCLILGSAIVAWDTSIQAQFLKQIGVSEWGAITIEPLLVVASFLLGVRIKPIHRAIALGFLLILFGISLITVTSMYAQKSYIAIEQHAINENLAKRSTSSEDVIVKTLDKLGSREYVSSKNITKVIDQLQKQQEKTEKRSEPETLELKSIIDVISSLLHVDDKLAVLIFSFFISLSAVFSPSFLFFSAGMMMQNTGIFTAVSDQIKRMEGLSLKQKIILMTKENVTDDIEEMAKFLGTKERIVKSQLSKINSKLNGEKDDEEGITI
jgi:DNA-binding CsgD family transcriptional regulator